MSASGARRLNVEALFDALHETPELGYEEVRTALTLAAQLRILGFDVTEGVAKTGVIGRMCFGSGPVVGLRADMDALPFVIDGDRRAVHACGHDAHAAMVLAAAAEIVASPTASGSLVVVLQPAEELATGAEAMARSGLLDDLDELIGVHLRPQDEAKLGQVTAGVCHGRCAELRIRIRGRAAHGARPHQGINALDVAAAAVGMINALRVDPQVPHSAKVTVLNTPNSAANVIPDVAELTLDLRAQTNAVMTSLLTQIQSVSQHAAAGFGATVEIAEPIGTPAAQYDPELVAAATAAIAAVGAAPLPPLATDGGEDFHEFQRLLGVRTCYIGVGADVSPALHHPEMTFDRRALGTGRDVLAELVRGRLLGASSG